MNVATLPWQLRPLSLFEKSLMRFLVRRAGGCTFRVHCALRMKSCPCQSHPSRSANILNWRQSLRRTWLGQLLNTFVHSWHGTAIPCHSGIQMTILDTITYVYVLLGDEDDKLDPLGHGGFGNTLF